jgi:chromosome segregation ATPase
LIASFWKSHDIFSRESERNKKAVERLRAQLQDALSSDRVAMLENSIVERDRVIESLTRDNRMLQRNALIQEKELESKRDIESDVAARVKEKNEDLRIMRERLKKFKELHSEQQKALHAQQQQQQRLQAAHDDIRRKLAAALSDPTFDADEARKQLVEKDTHIASLERELRIFRHKKESDGRVKGHEHRLKDSKVQQLQSAVEEAQLQLAVRGRELQAQSLRIKALEEEVHVWQQRARRHSKPIRNEVPSLSSQNALQKGEISSQSPFLTDVLDCEGPGLDKKEYRYT